MKKCYSLKPDESLDKILSIKKYCWSLTEVVSVENYEIKFSRSDYTHILEYLCRISFLTTLDIYNNYFKSRHKVMQSDNTCILWPETEFALVHHILCKSYCVFMPRVLWPRASWSSLLDELKNFAANIFLKLVC